MADDLRVFDVHGSVEFLRSVGFKGATLSTVRALIASGQVPKIRCGKKFFVTEAAWKAWAARAEKRRP
jgi:hypothetical protein